MGLKCSKKVSYEKQQSKIEKKFERKIPSKTETPTKNIPQNHSTQLLKNTEQHQPILNQLQYDKISKNNVQRKSYEEMLTETIMQTSLKTIQIKNSANYFLDIDKNEQSKICQQRFNATNISMNAINLGLYAHESNPDQINISDKGEILTVSELNTQTHRKYRDIDFQTNINVHLTLQNHKNFTFSSKPWQILNQSDNLQTYCTILPIQIFNFCVIIGEQDISQKFEKIRQNLMEQNQYQGDPMQMIDINFKLKELELLGEGACGKVYKNFDVAKWQYYALRKEYIYKKYLGEFALQLEISIKLNQNNSNLFAKVVAFQIDNLNNLQQQQHECQVLLELGICNMIELTNIRKNLGVNWSEQELFQIFLIGLQALDSMKLQNIAHLDIKPENIIIIDAHNIKFIDFGNSILVPEGLTQVTTGLTGTKRYMATEILKISPNQEADIDPYKADLFSLGMTLLKLSCNEHNRQNLLQHLNQKIQIEQFEFRQLYRILSKILVDNPDDRPSLQSIQKIVLDICAQYNQKIEFINDDVKKKFIEHKNIFTGNYENAESVINIVQQYISIYKYDEALELVNQLFLQKLSEQQIMIAQEQKSKALQGLAKYDEAIQIKIDLFNKYSAKINTYLYETLESKMMIGILYYQNKNYNKAIDILSLLQTTLDQIPKSQKLSEIKKQEIKATIYLNLGNAYQGLTEFDSALQNYQQSLKIVDKSNNLIEQAKLYGNIGAVYMKQNKLDLAMNGYKKSAEIYQKELGFDHIQTANAYNNISIILFNQGQYEKSLLYCQKCLQIRELKLGQIHSETAVSYCNIGLIYQQTQQNQEANKYFTKSLKIRRKILGVNNRLTRDTEKLLSSLQNS